ncbi:MAG: porin, partial [Gallionella sp.]
KDALSVAAGYRKLTSTTLNTSGTALATDNSNKSMILAGSYDLGMAKLYGQYASDTTDETVGATSVKNTYQTAGVNVPVSAELALYVELGAGKHDTGATTSPKYSASAIGAKYSLSKTSSVYFNYGQSKLDTVTKTTQTSVGLQHSF